MYLEKFKNEKETVKKLLYEKRTRTKQEIYQQYYTPDALCDELIKDSGILERKELVKILEPTAGDGAIVRALCNTKTVNFHIDMMEIDIENRKKLVAIDKPEIMCLHLLDHRNFLTYGSPPIYDYIFMNPPFHLRKAENPTLINDVYDFNFVERAYAMLKVGGVLMAIIGVSWNTLKKENIVADWIKNLTPKPKLIQNIEYSGVLVSNTYKLKIIKKNYHIDDVINRRKYYIDVDTSIGADIESGEIPLSELKTEPTEKVEIVEEIRIEPKVKPIEPKIKTIDEIEDMKNKMKKLISLYKPDELKKK